APDTAVARDHEVLLERSPCDGSGSDSARRGLSGTRGVPDLEGCPPGRREPRSGASSDHRRAQGGGARGGERRQEQLEAIHGEEGGTLMAGPFQRLGNDLYTGARGINFVGNRRWWFLLAGILMIASVAVPFVRGGGDFLSGFNFGIEFRGGSQFLVSEIPASDEGIDT